jgi:hypothetical protein
MAEATRGPTWARRAGTRLQAIGPACGLPPYLVLLRVGFTLPPPLRTERCALTAPFHPYPRACARWRYLLCGTSRLCALTRRSRTLSGTLPCGVRTFLPRTTSVRRRPSSPPAVFILRRFPMSARAINKCGMLKVLWVRASLFLRLVIWNPSRGQKSQYPESFHLSPSGTDRDRPRRLLRPCRHRKLGR